MIKNICFIIKRIWLADKRGIIWTCLYLIWGIIPAAFNALIFKLVIDSITEGKSLTVMFSIVALFSFINFMNSFIGSRIYGNRIASKLAMRVEAFFSEELLRKIQAIDAVKYDDPVFYDKLQKASAEVENRAMTVLNQVLSLFRCIANLLLGVGLLATLSPFFIVLAIAVGIAQYFLDLNFIKQISYNVCHICNGFFCLNDVGCNSVFCKKAGKFQLVNIGVFFRVVFDDFF